MADYLVVFQYDFFGATRLRHSYFNTRLACSGIGGWLAAESLAGMERILHFGQILDQCSGDRKKYGNICESDNLKDNYKMNCIPEGIENLTYEDYPQFLEERRKLMAQRIKNYFMNL